MSDKISLVLSGGASRGAFHLGVLQALDDANIKIDSISGASIGAIVGASYLSGNSPKDILKIFTSDEFKKAIKFKPFNGSIFSIDKESTVVEKVLNGCKNIEDLSKPLHVSVVNLKKGKVKYLNRGDLKDILLASSAFLPIFPPVKIGDDLHADGGIMDNLPVAPFKNSPYPILGVNLHPNKPPVKEGLMTNFKRAVFLCWYSGVTENIKKCDFYISPNELTDFPILKMNRFEDLFDLGFESAKKIL